MHTNIVVEDRQLLNEATTVTVGAWQLTRLFTCSTQEGIKNEMTVRQLVNDAYLSYFCSYITSLIGMATVVADHIVWKS